MSRGISGLREKCRRIGGLQQERLFGNVRTVGSVRAGITTFSYSPKAIGFSLPGSISKPFARVDDPRLR